MFDFPADNKNLYIFTSGTHGRGSIEILPAYDSGDEIVVDITGQYEREDIVEKTSLCVVSRGQGEQGLGLYVSLRGRSLLYHVTENRPRHHMEALDPA